MVRDFNLNKLYVDLLFYCFLILFPGMQAYSVARSLGMRSLYLPIVLYIFLLVLLFIKIIRIGNSKKLTLKGSLIVPTIVLVYVIFTIFISYFRIKDNNLLINQYYSTVQTGVVYSMISYLIGVNLVEIIESKLIADKKSRNLFKSFILVLLSCVFISTLNNYVLSNQFQISYSVDYLTISDGVAITLLVLYGLCNLKHARLLFSITMVSIMMLTISRGALLALVGALVSFSVINLKIKPIKVITLLFGVFALIIIYFNVSKNVGLLYDLIGKNRGSEIIIGLLFDSDSFLKSDPSMASRSEMMTTGWHDLKNVWFFGEFMRTEINGLGYIHNWLSFWHNYGVMPFLLFVASYVALFTKLIVKHRKKSSISSSIIILISFYTIYQIMFFRAYIYSTVWLSLGALASQTSMFKVKHHTQEMKNFDKNIGLNI